MSNLISFLSQVLISVLRMGIVAGLTVFLLINIINGITPTSLGELNLVLIVTVFCFFPIFFPLLVEFFFYFQRGDKKRKRRNNSTYKKA